MGKARGFSPTPAWMLPEARGVWQFFRQNAGACSAGACPPVPWAGLSSAPCGGLPPSRGKVLPRRTRKKKSRRAGRKPNPVTPKGRGHLSEVARRRATLAANPGLILRGPRQESPIWPCSRWGLPCPACHHASGALLPHRFTLACGPLVADPSAVCSLWHFPWAFARWALPTTVPFGVRTFLPSRRIGTSGRITRSPTPPLF